MFLINTKMTLKHHYKITEIQIIKCNGPQSLWTIIKEKVKREKKKCFAGYAGYVFKTTLNIVTIL